MGIELLEFRHIAPFEGCHWRYEYFVVRRSGMVLRYWPVVFTMCQISPDEVLDHGYLGLPVPREIRYYWDFFRDFRIYEWKTALDEEVIPAGYWPVFHRFCKNHNWIWFSWRCRKCSNKQTAAPRFAGEILNAGGAHYEPGGYLCTKCRKKETK